MWSAAADEAGYWDGPYAEMPNGALVVTGVEAPDVAGVHAVDVVELGPERARTSLRLRLAEWRDHVAAHDQLCAVCRANPGGPGCVDRETLAAAAFAAAELLGPPQAPGPVVDEPEVNPLTARRRKKLREAARQNTALYRAQWVKHTGECGSCDDIDAVVDCIEGALLVERFVLAELHGHQATCGTCLADKACGLIGQLSVRHTMARAARQDVESRRGA